MTEAQPHASAIAAPVIAPRQAHDRILEAANISRCGKRVQVLLRRLQAHQFPSRRARRHPTHRLSGQQLAPDNPNKGRIESRRGRHRRPPAKRPTTSTPALLQTQHQDTQRVIHRMHISQVTGRDRMVGATARRIRRAVGRVTREASIAHRRRLHRADAVHEAPTPPKIVRQPQEMPQLVTHQPLKFTSDCIFALAVGTAAARGDADPHDVPLNPRRIQRLPGSRDGGRSTPRAVRAGVGMATAPVEYLDVVGVSIKEPCGAVGVGCIEAEGGVTEPPPQGGVWVVVVGGEQIVPVAARGRDSRHQQAVAGAATDTRGDRVADEQRRVHRHPPVAGEAVADRGGAGHCPVWPPPAAGEVHQRGAVVAALRRHGCCLPGGAAVASAVSTNVCARVVSVVFHAACGSGRPQRWPFSARVRARSRRCAASRSGSRALALRQRR